MNRWVGGGLLLVIVGALALRAPELGLRPMHNDEAVNAVKIKELWEQGRYVYDPNEHHGPTLYYATLPFVSLTGAPEHDQIDEVALRAGCVFFGLVLIALIWLLADGLGFTATLIAALLTAISPAMVFYSRYFIHEMALVCFSLMLIGGVWRYLQKPHYGWAILAGAGLGLMYATKETFVLAVFAMVAAGGLTVLLNRWFEPGRPRIRVETRHVVAGVAMTAGVSLLLFTSFFTNASGPVDSLRTYIPWLKRAGGESPHIHPWYFYFERLIYFKAPKGPWWSEGAILLLGVAGMWASLTTKRSAAGNLSLGRFLTFYTILLTATYCLISYKTPWCLLGFWHGMILLAGLGAVAIWNRFPHPIGRLAFGLLAAAAAAHLSWQAWRASYPYAADPRNPYVYAQTVPNALQLVQKVQDIARAHPDGHQMLVKVMAADSDYWPLPWYLRQFERVGWWNQLPEDPFAPVMIVGANLRAKLDERSQQKWLMVGFFELRPKTFLELYVEYGLWERYVQSMPRTEE